jgi:hypothetical protein
MNFVSNPYLSSSHGCRMKGRRGADHCISSEAFTDGSGDGDLAGELGADVVNVLERVGRQFDYPRVNTSRSRLNMRPFHELLPETS